MIRWIDSHAHLDLILEQSPHLDLETILHNARQCDIYDILSISTTLPNFDGLAKLTHPYPSVYLACGVHPLSLHPFTLESLLERANSEKVLALGETGLDFYRAHAAEVKRSQQEAFAIHLEASKQLNKPVVIHSRNAPKETLDCYASALQGTGALRGVVHCFTESKDFAARALDLGLYISVSGILTFKNSHALQAIVKYLPLESLLIETDSPYLAPEPYRGQPNQPSFMIQTAKKLAELKQLTLNALAEQLLQNVDTLFKWPHLK